MIWFIRTEVLPSSFPFTHLETEVQEGETAEIAQAQMDTQNDLRGALSCCLLVRPQSWVTAFLCPCALRLCLCHLELNPWEVCFWPSPMARPLLARVEPYAGVWLPQSPPQSPLPP